MSRKDAHFLGNGNRTHLTVRKLSSSTRDQNCSETEAAKASPGSPGIETDERPIWRLQREIVCTLGGDTTWLPRSRAPVGFSKLSRALSFFLKNDLYFWSSESRAEVGITFIPSLAQEFHQNCTARHWWHLGMYTTYNQQMNWNTSERPCWAAPQGNNTENMIRFFFKVRIFFKGTGSDIWMWTVG